MPFCIPRDAKKKANKRLIIDSDSEEEDEDFRPPKRLVLDGESKYIKIIEKMNVDPYIKSRLISEVEAYEKIPDTSEEKHKQKKYFEGFVKIPFGKYLGNSVKKEDSFEKKRNFLGKIKHSMDKHVFGQEGAKNTLIEIIAKKINNPEGKGNIIALAGPPGVGKTSLVRDGLARAYGVPFNFISLGGARHSSLLKGSDFSFIGSSWGKIVDILIKSECMDPIIFFDELDKISTSDEGMDVVSCLVHLTDPSQNSEWSDTYFSGIPFDISRATFIFSLNDKRLIPEPLLDRITLIDMHGFSEKEKVSIAKKYCIPKLCNDIGFSQKDIIISDDTIKVLLMKYCSEPGVRKLEQCIRSILMKFNFYDMIELGDKKYKDFGPYEIDPHTAQIILDTIFGKVE